MVKRSLIIKALLVAFVLIGPAVLSTANVLAVDDPNITSDTNTALVSDTTNQDATTGPAQINPVPANTDPTSQDPPMDVTPANNPVTDNTSAPGDPTLPTCQTPSDPATGQNQPLVDPTSSTNVSSNLTLNNNLCSNATSGDAAVTGSNSGGNATSGGATATATMLNIIQSATGQVTLFTQDIYGNVYGDITLDPATLGNLLNNACGLCGGNGSLNSTTNSTINNNIYLNANSGNADVSNNSSGGNAASGNAAALLNLINIINSIIAGGNSFVGTINIYGNLNGDILLPQDILASLLAGSPPAAGGGGGSQLDLTNSQAINNNINVNATSGNATVNNNGTGGSATSGNATTNVTIYNFTGSQLIGQNALLVFVNVLGSWVGMIVNSPVGTNTAELGGGGGFCGCGGSNVNSNTNSQINNNIYLNASSGNATVSNSGKGGSATSGSATSTVNLINIVNSSFSLSGWLGILFINVFGTWEGSFGIDTSAGNPPAAPGSSHHHDGKHHSAKVFNFVPATGGNVDPAAAMVSDDPSIGGNVLGAVSNIIPAIQNQSSSWLKPGLSAALCCLLLLGLLGRRRQQDQRPLRVTPEIVSPIQ